MSGSVSYGELLDVLQRTVPHELSWIATTLPRGGLQIAQPQSVPEGLLRSYVRDYHRHDRATWSALMRNALVTGNDVWGGPESGDTYLREFMRPARLAYVAVVPLSSPVFTGYIGALHVYRTMEQGDFTEAERDRLKEVVARVAGRASSHSNGAASTQPARQFIFDEHGRQLLSGSSLSSLDVRLREQMQSFVDEIIEKGQPDSAAGDRLALADSRGDRWNFHVARFDRYPALSDGPVAFFCQIPNGDEWSRLRPADLEADPELARMVPAMQFMMREFRRVPTLAEIARTVHLSPFHFHRRFTELMGLTPKHFLLDCQIEHAKSELVQGLKELTAIATECGFAHQSHFTSRFKQATGLTPTRWRRAVGNGQA